MCVALKSQVDMRPPLASHELRRALAVATNAIRAAERHIESQNGEWTTKVKKREYDFATDLDLEVERIIRAVLKETDGLRAEFVGEEFGGSGDLDRGRHWVIDPIDGTTNLVRGIPTFSVTLALVVEGSPVIGIVSAPMLGERYTAVLGHGARMRRGKLRGPLAVSGVDALEGSLVSVNDIASLSCGGRALAGEMTGAIAARALQVRCHGSIGLDMAWVAAGRLEACVSFTNRPWDVVAGALLVREAGGSTYDTQGRDHTLGSTTAIGSTPRIKRELLGIILPTVAAGDGHGPS